MSRYVYLLLTRSNTFVSKAIYRVTRDEFTHISVSISDHMETMYSFCRRYPDLPLPAGFTSESIYHGFYKKHHTIPCRLYRVEVTEEQYSRLEIALALLMKKSHQLKYDIMGTMLCRFDVEHERYNHRYCSWFVAELLGDLGILEFEKHYSLIRPMDFTVLTPLELVYSGNVGELANLLETKNISEISYVI